MLLRRYEQVINRLKQERLSFPAEIKALEATLGQKEHDYEQLLLMSHDANHSKEVARQELSKFEMLVSEERKQREKELNDCRAVLQKKQMLATDLIDNERQRKQARLHPHLHPPHLHPPLHHHPPPSPSPLTTHHSTPTLTHSPPDVRPPTPRPPTPGLSPRRARSSRRFGPTR